MPPKYVLDAASHSSSSSASSIQHGDVGFSGETDGSVDVSDSFIDDRSDVGGSEVPFRWPSDAGGSTGTPDLLSVSEVHDGSSDAHYSSGGIRPVHRGGDHVGHLQAPESSDASSDTQPIVSSDGGGGESGDTRSVTVNGDALETAEVLLDLGGHVIIIYPPK